MNTKNVARRMASKRQRTLLAALTVMILFGSLPVGRAQAAGAFQSQVYCDLRSFRHRIAIQGAYNGQWVRYRLYVHQWVSTPAPGYWTQPTVLPWNTLQVSGLTYHGSSHSMGLPTTISVYTEVQYWDGRYWQPGGTKYALHYDPATTSSQNSYPWCNIW